MNPASWMRLAAVGGVAWILGCASPAVDMLPAPEPFGPGFDAGQDSPSGASEAPATLADYLHLAFTRNAGLRAAHDRWQAALERVPQSRSLDQPALSFEYFIEQMDTRYQASLTQMFPALGTLRRKEGQAAAEARAALQTFEAERFDLYERVARAVHEYGYLAQATDITAETLSLLEALAQAAEADYRSGSGSLADWTRAQIEQEQMAVRLAALRDQRQMQSVGLASVLNLPAEEMFPWPTLESDAPGSLDESFLAKALAELNPELKSADAAIEAARLGTELSRRAGWPAFMLGAGWMVMPGMEGRGDRSDASVMAGLSLPIWRGPVRAGVREADARMRAASLDRDEMHNRLRAELGMAVFQFRDAGRRVELFEGSLIPKAGQVLAAQQQAYAEGRGDLAALVAAHRTVLEFRMLAARAVADREIALADIGCCVGAFDVLGDPVGSQED